MSPTERTLARLRTDGWHPEVVELDAEDLRRFASTPVHINRVGDRLYAFVYAGKRKQYLHRLIAQPGPGQQVDHINGKTLDNRRANLRVCSQRENTLNSRARGGVCGYKGVTKHRGKYAARITVHGKPRRLGLFHYPEQAAAAYNSAAVKHFGEFARLNEIPDTVNP